MSANNWRTCPRCAVERRNEETAAMQAARDSYGKVPAEEYEAAIQEAESLSRTPISTTLREDWEIGTDENGEFHVGYSCQCKVCGFIFHYEHTEQTNAAEAKP